MCCLHLQCGEVSQAWKKWYGCRERGYYYQGPEWTNKNKENRVKNIGPIKGCSSEIWVIIYKTVIFIAIAVTTSDIIEKMKISVLNVKNTITDFSTVSILLLFFIQNNVLETGLCLHPQVRNVPSWINSRKSIIVLTYHVHEIWSHPASYPVGTRGSFVRGKAAGAWSWPLTSN
jgi:hypothetical protein